MHTESLKLSNQTAVAHVIPAGPVNLVMAVGPKGLIACGLVDGTVFNRFDFPAATIKASQGPLIATVSDLLQGVVRVVNEPAARLGVTPGMSGREALEKMG